MPKKVMAETNKRWTTRVIKNCDDMAKVIILLRDMAEARSDDAEFVALVKRLHVSYCKLANTLSLRVILNGVTSELGCADDDTERNSREITRTR